MSSDGNSLYPERDRTLLNATGLPGNALSIDSLKSDTVDLAVSGIARPMMVQSRGTAGNVKVTPAGGQAEMTLAMTAGDWVPFWVSRVWSTGTTVGAGLLGVW